jgi:hypothetical protein
MDPKTGSRRLEKQPSSVRFALPDSTLAAHKFPHGVYVATNESFHNTVAAKDTITQQGQTKERQTASNHQHSGGEGNFEATLRGKKPEVVRRNDPKSSFVGITLPDEEELPENRWKLDVAGKRAQYKSDSNVTFTIGDITDKTSWYDRAEKNQGFEWYSREEYESKTRSFYGLGISVKFHSILDVPGQFWKTSLSMPKHSYEQGKEALFPTRPEKTMWEIKAEFEEIFYKGYLSPRDRAELVLFNRELYAMEHDRELGQIKEEGRPEYTLNIESRFTYTERDPDYVTGDFHLGITESSETSSTTGFGSQSYDLGIQTDSYTSPSQAEGSGISLGLGGQHGGQEDSSGFSPQETPDAATGASGPTDSQTTTSWDMGPVVYGPPEPGSPGPSEPDPFTFPSMEPTPMGPEPTTDPDPASDPKPHHEPVEHDHGGGHHGAEYHGVDYDSHTGGGVSDIA